MKHRCDCVSQSVAIVLLFYSLAVSDKCIFGQEKKIPQVILSGHKVQQLCKETLKIFWQTTGVVCTQRGFHVPMLKEVAEEETHTDDNRKHMSCFYSSLSKLHPTAACMLEPLLPTAVTVRFLENLPLGADTVPPPTSSFL